MKNTNEKILIAEIVSAIGIKGEVKIKYHSDDVGKFKKFEQVYLSGPNGDELTCHISSVREVGGLAAIKIAEVADRNGAESLVGYGIYIDESQLLELPEDTYYVRDLVGLRVVPFAEPAEPDKSDGPRESGFSDASDGPIRSGISDASEPIGEITDVIQNTAQDIYVIKLYSGGNDVLVPAVKEFVKEVNVPEKYMIINFIEGMLP